MFSSIRLARAALTAAAFTALAACSSAPQPKFQQEMFDSGTSPFSRTFHVGSADACEAARRALLNQGYLTTLTQTDRIDATKDFQPSGDTHVTVEFHVVCTPGVDADGSSTIYANAIQDGYALKKSDTSASVGLSILGSVSLPIRSNSDAMVKVSSETIQSHAFYDRFFDSVRHYVSTLIKAAPVPVGSITTTALPGTGLVMTTTSTPASASTTQTPSISSTTSTVSGRTAPAPATVGAPAMTATPAPAAATSVIAPAASLLAPAVPSAAPAVSASAPLPLPVAPPAAKAGKPMNEPQADVPAPAPTPTSASTPASPPPAAQPASAPAATPAVSP